MNGGSITHSGMTLGKSLTSPGLFSPSSRATDLAHTSQHCWEEERIMFTQGCGLWLPRRSWKHRALRVWGLVPASPADYPHPVSVAVALSPGPLQGDLRGRGHSPAHGTSMAWQKEVLDPGDTRGRPKVPGLQV